MARPQRFPIKLEFWSTDAQLQGLETLCADGLSDKAQHLRQALQLYLRTCGVVPMPRPAANGHHQTAASA